MDSWSVFFRRGNSLFAALFGLDDFPIAQDFSGIFGVFFAEDVRVPANHLFVNFTDDIGDVEALLFAGDLGMEKDLE